MNKENLPKLKNKVNTEKYTLCMPAQLKKELDELKYQKGINVSEWLRRVIYREVEAVKAST